MSEGLRVLAAPDKFKGTASASEIAAAIERAAAALGADVTTVPMSDGGDGLLEVFRGPTVTTTVTGPDGRPVDAPWRLADGVAVVESARAAGLTLAGGREHNDPVAATSRGTGELVEKAVRAGARRILVGLGGSASTDGGLPAVDALSSSTLDALTTGRIELVVCCDVTTRYVDAAAAFGPQKGADQDDVALLRTRLTAARDELEARFGVDVATVPGSGAAGGLGGALHAVGGRLRSGFDVVTDEVGLARLVADSDLVVTGEGRVDEHSFAGKVVGGVLTLCRTNGVPALVIAGDVDGSVSSSIDVVSLTSLFGRERAERDVLTCVTEACANVLRTHLGRPRRA